jgi:hypothetical protein
MTIEIKRDGQLWEFIDRWSKYSSPFARNQGNVCLLAKAILDSVLKVAIVTAVCFVVLQALFTPWFTLVAGGSFADINDDAQHSVIPLLSGLGVALHALIAMILFCLVWDYVEENWSFSTGERSWLKAGLYGIVDGVDAIRNYTKSYRDKFCAKVILK